MVNPRIIRRRRIIHKPVAEVVCELRKEGWPLIADNNDKAFLYGDRSVRTRVLKAAAN